MDMMRNTHQREGWRSTREVILIPPSFFSSPPLRYQPVQDVADACRTGAATDIIFGLALGYKVCCVFVCCVCVVCVSASLSPLGMDLLSPPMLTHTPRSPALLSPQSCIIPTIVIAITIFVGNSLAGMYGIATAALGMLSTLATGLAIDAYGPISGEHQSGSGSEFWSRRSRTSMTDLRALFSESASLCTAQHLNLFCPLIPPPFPPPPPLQTTLVALPRWQAWERTSASAPTPWTPPATPPPPSAR
jgi:hypothetical protein